MSVIVRRFAFGFLVLINGVISPQLGSAQSDCFASFNVKDAVVTIDWVAGGGTPKTMQCVAAERLREEIYINNKEIFDNIGSGAAASYVGSASAEIDALGSSISELESKVATNESLSSLQIAGEVMLYSLGKASALVGCIAPDPGASKVFCVVGLTEAAKGTYDIMTRNIAKNDFSEMAAEARAELATAKARLIELKSISQSDMGDVAENARQMFFGYCEAIKRDCL